MDIITNAAAIPEAIRKQVIEEIFPKINQYGSDTETLRLLFDIDRDYITFKPYEVADLHCAMCINERKQRWYKILASWKK